jgi:hypothetical protein
MQIIADVTRRSAPISSQTAIHGPTSGFGIPFRPRVRYQRCSGLSSEHFLNSIVNYPHATRRNNRARWRAAAISRRGRRSLLDDFGRLLQDRWRDGQSERLSGPLIDDEIKLRGLLDREV